jgi:hypothetical protein
VKFLNNCQLRPHSEIFNEEYAIFDLSVPSVGFDAFTGVKFGSIVIVANKISDSEIVFKTCRYTAKKLMDDNIGIRCLVLLGDVMNEEVLAKSEAAKHKLYKNYFDVNGNFKRASVL